MHGRVPGEPKNIWLHARRSSTKMDKSKILFGREVYPSNRSWAIRSPAIGEATVNEMITQRKSEDPGHSNQSARGGSRLLSQTTTNRLGVKSRATWKLTHKNASRSLAREKGKTTAGELLKGNRMSHGIAVARLSVAERFIHAGVAFRTQGLRSQELRAALS
jgi:hypothetical protein